LREFGDATPGNPEPALITLEITPGGQDISPEAYKLSTADHKIQIEASGASGLFYGIQTLLQLAEPSLGKEVPCVEIEDWPLISLRSVHLDLRSNCLMPTFEYLIETIKELARYKINAVVLEWEDKFPYQQHPEIVSPLALTPEQVQTLLAVAAQHHVRVVPLMQTLGHVEYILKLPQYAELRERAGDISQFCPCDANTLPLVYELLDELMAAHPDLTFVHLGGDEPWLLGSCPRCAAKAEKQGISAVYLDHIGEICRHVLAAGKIPVIWGDVVIGQHTIASQSDNWLGQESQSLANLSREVRMVYWEYHSRKPSDLIHFESYRKQGFPVWGAPAIRFGDIVPDHTENLDNINAMIEASIIHKAEGVLITSWVWKDMPFEVTWHGLVCSAERAWSGGSLTMEELESRATQLFYGADLPEAVEAMHLLSYVYWKTAYKDAFGQSIRASYLSRNPGHMHPIPDPERLYENAVRAQELLAHAQSKTQRHTQTLADWALSARLVAHVSTKQILFDRYETLLNTPSKMLDRAGLAQLRESFEALAKERQELEVAWREALLRTNLSEEVERDNALRFAGERAHTTLALEQLHVFEVAEGRRIWR
ncbi:MAG TPA: glycoside hydrolase family 20 zincin-like fold domain-containing protein, partial [Ktedonobacteraceae bacterium]